MRLRDNCTIREISGEKVIIIQGKEGVDLTKVIMLNETSEMIWKTFAGKDFMQNEIVDFLIETYGIDAQTATADTNELVEKLKNAGLLSYQ